MHHKKKSGHIIITHLLFFTVLQLAVKHHCLQSSRPESTLNNEIKIKKTTTKKHIWVNYTSLVIQCWKSTLKHLTSITCDPVKNKAPTRKLHVPRMYVNTVSTNRAISPPHIDGQCGLAFVLMQHNPQSRWNQQIRREEHTTAEITCTRHSCIITYRTPAVFTVQCPSNFFYAITIIGIKWFLLYSFGGQTATTGRNNLLKNYNA